MKKGFLLGFIVAGILLFPAVGLHAEDMRVVQTKAREKKAVLLEEVNREKGRAAKEAAESRQSIFADKSALKGLITRLEGESKNLEAENRTLKENLNALESREKELLARREEVEGNVRELVGFVRVNAKDIDVLLGRSMQSALVPGREAILQPILNQTEYPGMDHIRSMVDLLFDEIILSGQVRIEKGPFVNRAGEEVSGDILMLGNFSAAYQSPEETGFLLYSDDNRHLFALSKSPPPGMAKKLEAYLQGESEDVPIDISKGAALRQLTPSSEPHGTDSKRGADCLPDPRHRNPGPADHFRKNHLSVSEKHQCGPFCGCRVRPCGPERMGQVRGPLQTGGEKADTQCASGRDQRPGHGPRRHGERSPGGHIE